MSATRDLNLYEILEVSKTASEDEIKTSYKKLAFKYHPDKNNGSKVAEDKFKDLASAYEILSDAKKRQEYDQILNINTQSSIPPSFSSYLYNRFSSFFSKTPQSFFQWSSGVGIIMGEDHLALVDEARKDILIISYLNETFIRRFSTGLTNIQNIAYLKGDRILVSSANDNAEFKIFNQNGTLLHHFDQFNAVKMMETSTIGKTMMTVSNDGTINLFDVKKYQRINSILASAQDMACISILERTLNQFIVAGQTSSGLNKVLVYDDRTLRLEAEFLVPDLVNIFHAFTRDLESVAFLDQFNHVAIYEFLSGKKINSFKLEGIGQINQVGGNYQTLDVIDTNGLWQSYNYQGRLLNSHYTNEKNIKSCDLFSALKDKIRSQERSKNNHRFG